MTNLFLYILYLDVHYVPYAFHAPPPPPTIIYHYQFVISYLSPPVNNYPGEPNLYTICEFA
jgi:hypothetical protein